VQIFILDLMIPLFGKILPNSKILHDEKITTTVLSPVPGSPDVVWANESQSQQTLFLG
jgi:hypothetical protein